MNRMFKALAAFALALVLMLSLASVGLCAAAAAPEDAAGYLVVLKTDAPVSREDLPALPGDVLSQATLMASFTEYERLEPLAEEWGIYKAATLSDIDNLVWSGQVASVEPDVQAELFALDIEDPANPNDDYFTSHYQFNLTDVNVQSAWDAGLTGEGVTVAVIDSGLNVDHLDAPIKVARGRYYYYREEVNGRYEFIIDGQKKYYNYYSSDYIVDDVGHGTMVSGLIAANTNNRSGSYTGGIAGMAPNATIMPVRCFTNAAGYLGGYVSNLVSGVNFAVENGADVINMSWGIRTESAALQTAITNAANAGCILLAAVGNDGSATLQYPAAYGNVIGVGSTNKQGGLSNFSQRNQSVAVCAPGGTNGGQQIYSLWYTSSNAIGKGDGTSFSCPIVSGAAALMKEHDPTMTQADFLAMLQASSSLDHIAAADRPYAGCGAMDLKKMLDLTGHAGTMLRYNANGSVTVRGACHPASGPSLSRYALVLIGVYNQAGHLLDSSVATSDRNAGYGSYSHCATFSHPDAHHVQVFFLDNTTLCAVAPSVETVLVR